MNRRAKPAAAEHSERLQKLLARAGLGSRRGLERDIAEGKIKINSSVATLGDQAQADDLIEYEGIQYVVYSELSDQCRVILLNKPEGVICTNQDPEGRKTAFDHLPKLPTGRWVMIGRLDINTTGLLLFTNDGELANQMMHPSHGVDREYACRVLGEVSNETLTRLTSGVELEDGEAKFSDIVAAGGSGENNWYHVSIMEGRNREVRRLWEAVGHQVSRLKRVRYGPVFLAKSHRVGRWEELPSADVRILREDVGLSGRSTGQLLIRKTRTGGQKRRR